MNGIVFWIVSWFVLAVSCVILSARNNRLTGELSKLRDEASAKGYAWYVTDGNTIKFVWRDEQ
jgi:hypothetical protein